MEQKYLDKASPVPLAFAVAFFLVSVAILFTVMSVNLSTIDRGALSALMLLMVTFTAAASMAVLVIITEIAGLVYDRRSRRFQQLAQLHRRRAEAIVWQHRFEHYWRPTELPGAPVYRPHNSTARRWH